MGKMKTKIKSITVIAQPEVRRYEVGQIYNELVVAKIEDRSIEYPDALHFYYTGETADGAMVFGIINAPVDIEYMPDAPEGECPQCDKYRINLLRKCPCCDSIIKYEQGCPTYR